MSDDHDSWRVPCCSRGRSTERDAIFRLCVCAKLIGEDSFAFRLTRLQVAVGENPGYFAGAAVTEKKPT